MTKHSTETPPTNTEANSLGLAEREVRERSHVLASAGYWFQGSRNAQNDGHNAEAVMFMENAYNHVENALAAAIELLRDPLIGGSRHEEKVDRFLAQFVSPIKEKV